MTLPTTRMMAIRMHSYGDPEVLQYEEMARPAPAVDEVLVRVYAASVNPFDWKIRNGSVRLPLAWAMRPGHAARHSTGTLPVIPGFDIAGVVEAVGSEVSNFAVGDEVFGSPLFGGYAEYVAITVDGLAPKPQTLSFVEAAAMPIAAASAWQGLVEVINIQPGQTLLIHGAAGGIGTFAVQMAKARAAYVIATASGHNLDYLRQLGADEAIDYTVTHFEEAVHKVDAVLDLVGGETQQRSHQILKDTGILATVNNPLSGTTATPNPPRFQVYRMLRPIGTELAETARMADTGQLRPHVSVVLPLREARQAHRLSESKHARGKIVLQVRG